MRMEFPGQVGEEVFGGENGAAADIIDDHIPMDDGKEAVG